MSYLNIGNCSDAVGTHMSESQYLEERNLRGEMFRILKQNYRRIGIMSGMASYRRSNFLDPCKNHFDPGELDH